MSNKSLRMKILPWIFCQTSVLFQEGRNPNMLIYPARAHMKLVHTLGRGPSYKPTTGTTEHPGRTSTPPPWSRWMFPEGHGSASSRLDRCQPLLLPSATCLCAINKLHNHMWQPWAQPAAVCITWADGIVLLSIWSGPIVPQDCGILILIN